MPVIVSIRIRFYNGFVWCEIMLVRLRKNYGKIQKWSQNTKGLHCDLFIVPGY